MSTTRTLLFGRDRNRSLRAVAIGLGGLIAMVVFWTVGSLSEQVYDLLPVDVLGVIAALLFVAACWTAYDNDGLFVTWAVVALVTFGGTASGVGVGLQTPTSVERVGFAFATAFGAGVVVGTVGFVVGAGARRLGRWRSR